MLPAAERLVDARRYIGRGQYFVVHAPRQSGKTTSLAELTRQLTAEGDYVALHFTCEEAAPFGDDFAGAELAILSAIRKTAAARKLAPELLPPDPWPDDTPGGRLGAGLTAVVRKPQSR
jgi:hypothetical protein